MARKKITLPAPQEGAASAPTNDQAAVAPSPSEPEFRPIDGNTPLGTEILVRGEGLPETIAIRSLVVGWYASGFSQVLHIKPAEWAPLPTVDQSG